MNNNKNQAQTWSVAGELQHRIHQKQSFISTAGRDAPFSRKWVLLRGPMAFLLFTRSFGADDQRAA